MKIKNRRLWDGYVKANTMEDQATVLKFAQVWANEMEERLVGDKTVAHVAEATALGLLKPIEENMAAKSLILNQAVKVLYDVWEYGAPLRVWYENELDRET